MQLNVLLIGSGAREHAIAWQIAKSPLLKTLYCLGGNPAFNSFATLVCIDYDNIEHSCVIDLCVEKNIGLVVVGSEAPIINGLADVLKKHNIPCMAPLQAAAKLEGSKIFTRKLLSRYNIPAPRFEVFDNKEAAKNYIARQIPPIVIKASGPALGKGVFIAKSLEQAYIDLDTCVAKYGPAIVIEEYLEGKEISFFVLCDGQNFINFGSAKDYKRLYNHDEGPNTGGMGAYSSPYLLSKAEELDIENAIIRPSLKALQYGGVDYKGILFAGIMLTSTGPKLLEYNVRLGDPEAQTLLSRLESDILQLFIAAACGALHGKRVLWSNSSSVTIVITAKGYPDSACHGESIDISKFLNIYGENPDLRLFYGNVQIKQKSQPTLLTTNGGRLLSITATANNLTEARILAYKACDSIDYSGGFYRQDIAT